MPTVLSEWETSYASNIMTLDRIITRQQKLPGRVLAVSVALFKWLLQHALLLAQERWRVVVVNRSFFSRGFRFRFRRWRGELRFVIHHR